MQRSLNFALFGALSFSCLTFGAGDDAGLPIETVTPAPIILSAKPENWETFRTDLVDILASVVHGYRNYRILFLGTGVRYHYEVLRKLAEAKPDGIRLDFRYQSMGPRLEEDPNLVDLVLQELDVKTLPAEGAVVVCLENTLAEILADSLPAEFSERIETVTFPRAQRRVADAIPRNGFQPVSINQEAGRWLVKNAAAKTALDHLQRVKVRPLLADLAFTLDVAAFWEKIASGNVIPKEDLFYVEESKVLSEVFDGNELIGLDDKPEFDESERPLMTQIWKVRPKNWDRLILSLIENSNVSDGLLLTMTQQADIWENSPYTQERVFRILLATRSRAVRAWIEKEVLAEQRYAGNTHPGSQRLRGVVHRSHFQNHTRAKWSRAEFLMSVCRIVQGWIRPTSDWHRHRNWNSDPDNHRGLLAILTALMNTHDNRVNHYIEKSILTLPYWDDHADDFQFLLSHLELSKLRSWFAGRPSRPCHVQVAQVKIPAALGEAFGN